MSELIDNASRRKDLLRSAILDLHRGAAPAEVRQRVIGLLGEVPHHDVVAVEQQLVNEGMPAQEIARMCDLHAQALQGTITLGRTGGAPAGHPVHTFRKENEALSAEVAVIERLYADAAALPPGADPGEIVVALRGRFNALMDVDKHYLRKEFLLFPFLEKRGITAPPKVMWAKHDEARALLRAAQAALSDADSRGAFADVGALVGALRPASDAVSAMVFKEERILLPMSFDAITESEWGEIARQEHEYGYCLYAPAEIWRPAGSPEPAPVGFSGERLRFPSGSLAPEEILAIFGAVPVDMTFVDAEDRVRFFTLGKDRVFSRSRAVIGRKVQFCHPPSSASTVERILEAFRAGREDRATFWLEIKGRFIHIEYLALRGGDGKYLGCLEVSQDLTEKRALSGEQRLLSWSD